jgi:hypothetical protein
MTTDYRALCVELNFIWSRSTNPDDLFENMIPLVDRARAALAQSEPAGSTDEEIEKTAAIIYEAMRAINPMGKPYWEDADNSTEQNESRKCARAVLARWGTPAIQPEPVAPTDEELLASVRHFYGDQTAADMGAEDDLRTARAVLARYSRPTIKPVSQS